MSEDHSKHRPKRELSRRVVLARGLVMAAGASAGLFAGSAPAGEAGKTPKQQAGYQGSPKGAARCENCAQYQPPSSCKLVEGAVSPLGWCTFFAAKAK